MIDGARKCKVDQVKSQGYMSIYEEESGLMHGLLRSRSRRLQ